MLTLFYAPHTRATRILALLEELGVRDQVAIETVSVARHDGAGGADPRNPHPDKKVPLLVHDGVEIWESTAIALYLTELFPRAGLDRAPGAPDRGRLLSWLAWYGDVMEPVLIHAVAGLDHPILRTTFRGLPELAARLSSAVANGRYLMGQDYSVADLICASSFQYLPHLTPDDPSIAAWLDRCAARPALQKVLAEEAALQTAAA